MALKRIKSLNIDWTALAERVPEQQKPLLIAFKARSDGYLRRMLANPESPPKFDWSFYANRIPIKGLVADFQKQYEALAIPYPKDSYTALVDAQESATKKEIEDFKKESDSRIAKYELEIQRLKALIPFEKMTMEEYYDAFPAQSWDPNNPTFWPHTPEEQPGYYKDKPEVPSH